MDFRRCLMETIHYSTEVLEIFQSAHNFCLGPRWKTLRGLCPAVDPIKMILLDLYIYESLILKHIIDEDQQCLNMNGHNIWLHYYFLIHAMNQTYTAKYHIKKYNSIPSHMGTKHWLKRNRLRCAATQNIPSQSNWEAIFFLKIKQLLSLYLK